MAYQGGHMDMTDALRAASGDMGPDEVIAANEHIKHCRPCQRIYAEQLDIVGRGNSSVVYDDPEKENL